MMRWIGRALGARRRARGWAWVALRPSTLCLVLVLLLAGFADRLTPYGEAEIDPVNGMDPPSLVHPMGTDGFGRDILTRVLYGGRLSLLIGFASAGIGAVGGLAIGIVAGYVGGKLDNAMMRVTDVMVAFPGTLLALVIVAMLGASITNLIIAVGIAFIPGCARLVRSLALSIRETDYVMAARSLGCKPWWILMRHVFPNLRSSLIVYTTLNVATAILNAAALGFLGLGSRPPTAEWGLMVADGRDTLEIAWWITAFPGLALLATTLTIYAFGETLNAAFDPRARS